MRRRVTVGVVALAVLSANVLSQETAKTAPEGVLLSAGELKWMDNPGRHGSHWVALWGNADKRAYGVLRKFPGGTVLGAHTHGNADACWSWRGR